MADLNALLNIKGVIAAGRFDDKGNLIEVVGGLSQEEAAMAAKMCAANNALADMEVSGFAAISGKEWTPLHGWALAGPELAVCVAGNIGVIVSTKEVSFNEVFKALAQ